MGYNQFLGLKALWYLVIQRTEGTALLYEDQLLLNKTWFHPFNHELSCPLTESKAFAAVQGGLFLVNTCKETNQIDHLTEWRIVSVLLDYTS